MKIENYAKAVSLINTLYYIKKEEAEIQALKEILTEGEEEKLFFLSINHTNISKQEISVNVSSLMKMIEEQELIWIARKAEIEAEIELQ